MGKRFLFCVALAGLWLAMASVSSAYDIYKENVPDLDKPNPGDNSCWLASAANLLGGTGWGDTGQIYNTLLNHFDGAPGWSSVAINWWIYTHGLNPECTDFNPNPANYLDVTIVAPPTGLLTATDYDNLLSELDSCQSVNVSFEIPGSSIGHEMTLVGGNWSATPPPPTGSPVSVWHDNQGDLSNPPGDDDEYTNIFKAAPQFWTIDYYNTPGNPDDDFEADGATIFCPGELKPASAIQNYDVAWFKDMNLENGTLFNTMLTAGEKDGVYTLPTSGTEPEWLDETHLQVPNEVLPDLHKELWLMVDFIDRGHYLDDPLYNVLVQDDMGILYNPTDIDISEDGGQAVIHWVLPNQPAWETLIFPDPSYNTLYDISTGLGGVVKDWNLATDCVPEPSTLVLLLGVALGAAWHLCRRKG